MAQLIIRSELPPPPELPKELHHAFAAMCERLGHSGVDLSPQDLAIVSHVVQAEASLERAKTEAAQSPLTIDSPANGVTISPIHKLVASAESNLRAWLKLLPKAGSGGRIPSSHVTPTPAPAGGDAVEPPGQPSERLQRLRAIIAQFQADQASAGAAAGGAAAGVGGCVDAAAAGAAAGDGVAGAAAGVGGCVDAAAAGVGAAE